jgi:hypothetical protein
MALADLRAQFGSDVYTILEESDAESEASTVRVGPAEERDELRRMELLVPLYVCFVLGAGAGGRLGRRVGVDAILVPAGLSALLGLAYTAFRVALARRARRAGGDGVELAERGGALTAARRMLGLRAATPAYEQVGG